VQLVPLLESAGLAAATAVWVASMKGFAQFGGRVVEIFFGRRLHAMTVARIAIGALPVSFVVLLVSGGRAEAIVAFTLVMGASQGVITIVRGAVPLALFGKEGYGMVLGVLATPVIVMNACSPMLFAALGKGAIMTLVVPYPEAGTAVAVGVPLVEAVLAWALALARLRTMTKGRALVH